MPKAADFSANERWNRGTVRGVSVVLPGLKIRADANSDLCANGL